MEDINAFDKFELQLTETAKGFLREAAKWAYFLSIIGYIGLGFLVLFAFFAASLFATMGGGEMGMMGALGGTFITVLYLIIALVYFFPIYYLNKFATNVKAAFKNDNTESLTAGFGYLKSHYKFIAILTIVGIVLYILMFVVMFVIGMGASM